MLKFPADLAAAHDALASLYSSHLERELANLLPPGTPIILTDGHVRFPGCILRHTLHIAPERSTATIHLELSSDISPANLGAELTLELRSALLPVAIPCRLTRDSGSQADVTVVLQDSEPIARVQKTLPSAAECQHFLESKADDLCLVLTRGSLMEGGQLAPRCKDALRLLFSEAARQQPANVCHELARTLAALQSEADEHPLLWPTHIRLTAATLLDKLNALFAQ